MNELEEYITVGKKRMRCGYTTGTCAAAAARAAAELFINDNWVANVSIATPSSIEVLVEVEQSSKTPSSATCAVRKDAGDDIDATNHVLVYAQVEPCEGDSIIVEGGLGVGRITREGLDQPVGAAAINSVPRSMIEEQVRDVCQRANFDQGLLVTISIPEGVDIAKHTFNPRLGITGGISVLGTSGIVRPMSQDALIASINLELDMLRAAKTQHLLVSPGNYGFDFARDELDCATNNMVQCSNFIGSTIDHAVTQGFESMLIIGHLGKLAKVAAGVMNTHSRVADARCETMAAHAALAGASKKLVQQIMKAITVDEMLDIISEESLVEPVCQSLTNAIENHLHQRAGETMKIEAIIFSRKYGYLGQTSGALKLLQHHKLQQK